MTTWQAIVSTATQSPQSMGRPAATEPIPGRSAKTAPAFTSILQPMAGHAVTAWKWLERKRTEQLSGRRLRVAETIQLGEKCFVSILQVDGAQFLIGGAAGNVSLLAVLAKDQGAAEAIAVAEGSL